MKLANIIKVNVFCKSEDSEELILQRLRTFFPFSLEEEKIPIAGTKAAGFNEREIKVIEVVLEKDRHINAFLEHLAGMLSPEQKTLLIRQLDTRIDDDLDFFLRFDKDKLLNDNVLWITDGGNCFHIKVSIAAFPRKKEIGAQIIEKVFK